jgi:hypothetical protein
MKQGLLEKTLNKISKEYFGFLGKNFPVMSSSDEFYFLPQLKTEFIDFSLLDNLNKDKIRQSVSYIKTLKAHLKKLISLKNLELETQIDLMLLLQSMSGFLREFDELRLWMKDPSPYLKIILFSIEIPLSKLSFAYKNIEELLLLRMRKIPNLLIQAENNLKQTKIPPLYQKTSLKLTDSLIDYFSCLPLSLKISTKKKLSREIELSNRKILSSLKNFRKFLKRSLSPSSLYLKERKLIKDILFYSYSYKNSLEKIFEIAQSEYENTLRKMKKIAKSIDPKRSWREILTDYKPQIKNKESLLKNYSLQIKKLKAFLKDKNILTIPEAQPILVKYTPPALQPIRASASYASCLTNNPSEPAYFYISGDFTRGKISALHKEYIFVTAHETYPGHHLLDTKRKNLKNPIRAQIESPLFYEGWASYAERLIDEFGYVKDPVQRLIGLRRNAWRAIRAMIDVGIRINRLKEKDGFNMLKKLGYEERAVKEMIEHYLLMPGYQLCYTTGKYEFEKLRRNFEKKFGLKRFHDIILESGQIPFRLLKKRMDELCRKSF